MTLIKYNEVMENVSVDPAMKSRIMSAVSTAIKEQSAVTASADKDAGNRKNSRAEVTEIPKRKKASRAPVIVISIAAGLLVVGGMFLGFGKYLKRAKAASESVSAHNLSVQNVNYAISEVLDGGGGRSHYDSAETAYTTDGRNEPSEESIQSSAEVTTTVTEDYEFDGNNFKNPDGSVIGDPRLDRISKALPFDLKGYGTGTLPGGSTSEEVFFGVNGERLLVLSADNSDWVKGYLGDLKNITPVNGTTPGGTVVRLYRVAFGNVGALGKGETSTELNAAYFVDKNGKSVVIIFSDPQSEDAIYKVVDAL